MKYSDIYQNNCGIYMIQNMINGKKYIGQSHNIKTRWEMHKAALRHNRAANRHLQFAWNKYGENSFEFSILEYCNIECLDDRENYWINFYNSTVDGYNIRDGGNSSRGWKMSDESKQKISSALTGRTFSAEHCKNVSLGLKEHYKTHIPKQSRTIICLNTGETFANGTQVKQKYSSVDISALHECCKGKHLSCGKDEFGNNLVWVYKEDYDKLSSDEIRFKLKNVGEYAKTKQKVKAVKCITTNKVFDSLKEAADYYNISVSNLNGCLKGRQKTAGKEFITNQPLYWAYCG